MAEEDILARLEDLHQEASWAVRDMLRRIFPNLQRIDGYEVLLIAVHDDDPDFDREHMGRDPGSPSGRLLDSAMRRPCH